MNIFTKNIIFLNGNTVSFLQQCGNICIKLPDFLFCPINRFFFYNTLYGVFYYGRIKHFL